MKDTRVERFLKAMEQFKTAAENLDQTWHARIDDDLNILNYPKYLPSFDEFVGDIQAIEITQKAPQRRIFSYNEWLATKKYILPADYFEDHADAKENYDEAAGMPIQFIVYAGGCMIEQHNNGFHLTIGNNDFPSEALSHLERILYCWYTDEIAQ